MKKILNFIGNSCTGKTTLSKLVFEARPHCFFLSFDSFKWQFSGYNRDADRSTVAEIERSFLPALLKQEEVSFIISDFIFTDEEDFETFRKSMNIGKEDFINIYLEAPLETRFERWKERVAYCKKVGRKISITTEDLFFQQAKEKFYCPENAVRFDTSIQSKEEILESIQSLI